MIDNPRRHLRWVLDIQTERTDGALVVVLAGRITGRSAWDLAKVIDPAIDAGIRTVVLDLAAVDYVSSAGLQIIQRAAARLAVRGATLTVRAASDATRITLTLAGLGGLTQTG